MKVKLPKPVADAITSIRDAGMAEHGLYDYSWLEGEVDDTADIRKAKDAIIYYIDRTDDRFEPDNQLITYYRALVNGYEVEHIPTPREKVQILLAKIYGYCPSQQTMSEIEAIYNYKEVSE